MTVRQAGLQWFPDGRGESLGPKAAQGGLVIRGRDSWKRATPYH